MVCNLGEEKGKLMKKKETGQETYRQGCARQKELDTACPNVNATLRQPARGRLKNETGRIWAYRDNAYGCLPLFPDSLSFRSVFLFATATLPTAQARAFFDPTMTNSFFALVMPV